MNKLEELYNMTKLQRKSVGEQIIEMQKNEKVMEYIELCRKKSELKLQETELYKKICFSKYDECNHIWINTLHYYDEYEAKSYNYYACIKCGLDKRVYHLQDQKKPLNPDQIIMLEYLSKKYKDNGFYTKISFDLERAKDFYKHLLLSNPSISDEDAISALDSYIKNNYLTSNVGTKLILK